MQILIMGIIFLALILFYKGLIVIIEGGFDIRGCSYFTVAILINMS